MKKKKLMGFMTVSMFAVSGLIASPVALAHGPGDPPPPGNLLVLSDPIMRGGFAIALETVATGLTAPNWGTFAPGDGTRLFVTDQIGILWAIDLTKGPVECDVDDPGSPDCTVFLDARKRLVDLGIAGPGSFDERGLLGVAFHPDYATSGTDGFGLLYTYTSEPNKGKADFSTMPKGEKANHQAVIREWQVSNPTNPAAVVDKKSRELLRIDEPQFNHDGGGLSFGPGGLYISLGDGGGADDQGIGHNEEDGNGQDTSNILGSILRIDPLGDNSANGKYGIPTENPFADVPGCEEEEGGCDEIYAFGFRNPFRFSFDKDTDDLYIGDVGQNDIEEVDVIVAGDNSGPNYGWRLKEGSFFFIPDPDTFIPDPDCNQIDARNRGCAVEDDPGIGDPEVLAGLIDPIAEYDTHTDGHAVIGGFVYRGTEIEQLVGRYVFGEFGRTRAAEPPTFRGGRLFVLNKKDIVTNGIKVSKIEELKDGMNNPIDLLNVDGGGVLLGMGQDADGELYVMANETSVPFNDPDTGDPTGVVLKITPGN